MVKGEFAEVIESSLQKYRCQSWSQELIPEFGSLVLTSKSNIWGLVYDVQTAPNDPIRQPQALRLTDEELQKQHPQIYNFIETTFSAIVVGHGSNHIFYHLSPFAAKLHSFVKKASIDEEKVFFKDYAYLDMIFENSQNIVNLNELLLAIINRYNKLGLLNNQLIAEFINNLSHLYGNDYIKLNLLLKRMDNLLAKKNIQS
jgi:hypothetical protein